MNSLQVFRGLAALAVVAHHAALSTHAFVGQLPTTVYRIFAFGALGVDFFFVLSGFIITWAHFEEPRGAHSARKYLARRILRIFPAYLPVGVAMLLLYALFPHTSAAGRDREISLMSSIFLLPSSGQPALSVAWTLVHELLFYGVFTAYFFSRKGFVVGLVVWVAIILLAHATAPQTNWLRYPLSLLNLEFLIGCGAAWLVRARDAWSGRIHHRWALLLGMVVVMGTVRHVAPSSVDAVRIVFAGGLALLVIGFSTRDLAHETHWPTAFLMLGNASYSVYLVHNPMLSFTQRLLAGAGVGWIVALLIGILLGVVAGLIYFALVEDRLRRLAQSRIGR